MKRFVTGIAILALSLLTDCGWNPFCPGDENDVALPPVPVYPPIDEAPSFSPDGMTIVYYHTHIIYIYRGGGSDPDIDSTGLWFVDIDGANPRMFLQGLFLDHPDWSPCGEWIAFVVGARVWKIRVDGTGLTQLTFGRRTFFPSWSPDGKKIAYDQTAPTDSPPPGIWIMDADGSNHRWRVGGRMPDWCPAGTLLVYEGPGAHLWIADTSGTDARQLTFFDKADVRYPAWSPEGSKIAFSARFYRPMEERQVWVIDTDGNNPRQLTTEGGVSPAWSPDGQKIVYTQHDWWLYDPRGNGTLWIMDADGSNKRRLTVSPAVERDEGV